MKTSKLNREWHAANRMPKNATDDERVAWHIEHQRHCQCRTMPKGVQELLRRHNAPVKRATRSSAG
jgi:hypothetical protein